MDKNEKVHINTVNDYEDHKDEQTNVYQGSYSAVNGKIFCIYDDEECRNTIKIDKDKVHLSRKSSRYGSTMFFVGGEESTSCHTFEGTSMTMNIMTKKLDVAVIENRIDIDISYTLSMDDMTVSENRVKICITEWR